MSKKDYREIQLHIDWIWDSINPSSRVNSALRKQTSVRLNINSLKFTLVTRLVQLLIDTIQHKNQLLLLQPHHYPNWCHETVLFSLIGLTVTLLRVHVPTSRFPARPQSSQSAFPHVLPTSWVTMFCNYTDFWAWTMTLWGAGRQLKPLQSPTRLWRLKTSHANFCIHTWAPSSSNQNISTVTSN